jgi:hypothetical protein
MAAQQTFFAGEHATPDVGGRANPLADPRPLASCDRCGCPGYTDQAIHGGRSTIRTCNRCERFLGFPKWQGKCLQSRESEVD